MRSQHDSQLEMELIPRQTSIGIDSTSTSSRSSSPQPTTTIKSALYFMSSQKQIVDFHIQFLFY